MRTEAGMQQDLDYFASFEKKCAICVYGIRRKKSQCIGSLTFVAQNQQQNIKVFDVSSLYIAVSSVEELREEKNQVLFLVLALIFSQSRVV